MNIPPPSHESKSTPACLRFLAHPHIQTTQQIRTIVIQTLPKRKLLRTSPYFTHSHTHTHKQFHKHLESNNKKIVQICYELFNFNYYLYIFQRENDEAIHQLKQNIFQVIHTLFKGSDFHSHILFYLSSSRIQQI